MIQVYTGDGKGKTTAAVGQAIRAAGAGMKVIFFQFLKYGAFPSSEEKMLKKCGIKVVRFEEKSPVFDRTLDMDELKAQVKKDWNKVNSALKTDKFDMIVLDEVTYLINLKLQSEKEILKTVHGIGTGFQWVLTGRNASKGLVKAADLVTEMKAIKHPYKKGVKASQGIDF